MEQTEVREYVDQESADERKCPQCPKTFKTAFGVRRHLIDKHGLSKTDAKDIEVKNTKRDCKYCKESFSNVYKHLKVCKVKADIEKNVSAARVDRDEANRNDDDVPDEFVHGGMNIMERWNKWLPNQGLKPTVQKIYTRKVKQMLYFFEANIPEFFSDSLLYPLELELCFPSLSCYLENCKTGGDKVTAIKAYRYLVGLCLYEFNKRYTTDSHWTIEKKNSYKIDMNEQRDEFSKLLKNINRENAISTAEKAAEKAEDPEHLGYNPDRLKQLLEYVVKNDKLKRMNQALNKLSVSRIKLKYDEVTCRHYIISMLLNVGAGARPSAIERMRIGEFLNAVTDEDGIKIVKVKDHKTMKGHGPCPIIFLLPGLYSATYKYLQAFRDPSKEDGYLFESARGTAADSRTSISWLKRYVLSDVLTEKETKTLSPKVFRHAWSNWGQEHPDPEINSIAVKAMCHSAPVQKSNYAVLNVRRVSKFGKAMIGDIVQNDTEDHDSDVDDDDDERDKERQNEAAGEEEDDESEREEQNVVADYLQIQLEGDDDEGDNEAADSMGEQFLGKTTRGTFSDRERQILKEALCCNGVPPNKLTQMVILKGARRHPGFKALYWELVNKKGDQRKANNAIRKSIYPKKKINK